MTILPIDEINAIKDRLKVHFEDGEDGKPGTGRIKSKEDCEDIIDELLDLFLLSYANGVESVNNEAPRKFEPTTDEVETAVYEKIDGKTWIERVWGHYDSGGTMADIMNIVRTEAHRDANEGAYDAAKAVGKTTKVWHCMMLDTSRDDHIWLDGVSAPLDGYFYAPGGERTLYPGEWGVPEQDCNCLCFCTYE